MSAVPDQPLTCARSPLDAPFPAARNERLQWGNALGSSAALATAGTLQRHAGLGLLIAHDSQQANRLAEELRFYLADAELPVLQFPDWETLPYDVFSPLPELVSQRLRTLHRLRSTERGVLIVPAATLMQRLAPSDFVDGNSILFQPGDRFDIEQMRQRLHSAGYLSVPQVMSHGEYAVRGSLLDLYPMGSDTPYRIDLFDDEIDSIRTFDPETQRTITRIERIEILPAHEFPTDDAAVERFRRQWREQFEGDPQRSLIYRDVSDGNLPGGIEYYLPLFHAQTGTLFDYLPDNTLLLSDEGLRDAAAGFFAEVSDRHEQRRHDSERPILPPRRLYLDADELTAALRGYPAVSVSREPLHQRRKGYASFVNLDCRALPDLTLKPNSNQPAAALKQFIAESNARLLLVADGRGRREMLADQLGGYDIRPTSVDNWLEFVDSDQPLAITAAPLEHGLYLPSADDRPALAVVPESLLLGERVRQSARRSRAGVDPDQVIRNLTELHVGSPVVHEEHGIGRYLGLQTLDIGGETQEFLTLEYANDDKLYVPVSSLHLISRYTGASEENAPLHRLGSEQWDKARRKAQEKARDVAAELLDIYARRAAKKGFAFPAPDEDYRQFAAGFEFEETPDQQSAIDAVIADMCAPQPMDRVVCGDVGFGKTEVALRAAFIAAHGGKQVAVVVPTTLLAQQHFQNFADRFADCPVKVESLSRFRSTKEAGGVLRGLADGNVDIVVGTHKLLGRDVHFKDLGLVIVDEEHRFGVRDKERLKSLRSEVDVLTLTATPIPRTLNMAMSGLRDLSVIATPPVARHPIQTFVNQWNDVLISEACEREIRRGGQVYFLHNEVSSIHKITEQLQQLLPGARIQAAHGQMRERELEAIMRDFYHQRFNVLVSTTIIESGIDVPSANTIIINRADKLGLAQLHQLRGRVGRSHHRAYAYLLTPHPKTMTPNAVKRLEAIASMEDLGAGFTLSTHDLEIRGAGELLGDEQSGQINEVGFSLYNELLGRAVQALKSGRQPELAKPLDHGTEVDMGLPALLPADYIPDVHTRLVQYKRIANAASAEELRELQVEMIDRFGLLPEPARHLFAVTGLKLRAAPIGIRKLEAGPKGGRIIFNEQPQIDPTNLIRLIQQRPREFQFDGGDKLRFTLQLEDRDSRVQRVEGLLQQICEPA